MEAGLPPEAPAESLPRRQRAAVWAWPLIFLAVAGMLLAPKLLPRAVELTEVEDYAASLVLLQIQARVIVAAAALDPVQAKGELEKLTPLATSDGAIAALAALNVFVDPTGSGSENAEAILNQRLEAGATNPKFIENVRAALRNGVTSEERESFRVNLGGFADFLPARGDPLFWPKREEIQKRSFRTLAVFGGTLFGAFLFGGIGLVLLIVAGVKASNGTLRPAGVASPGAAPVLLEAFALFLALFLVAQVLGWTIHGAAQIIVMILAVVVLMAWPLKRTELSGKAVRQACGLYRGRGVIREAFAGVAGYLAILPLAALGLILTLVLTQVGEAVRGEAVPPASHPIVGLMDGGWGELALVFFLASILAPVIEEISFRGAFYGAVRHRWSFVASGLITGFIFAVIHPQGIFAVPPLMAVGFGLAMIREWRGSLIAPMVAHAINNSVLLVSAMLMLR